MTARTAVEEPARNAAHDVPPTEPAAPGPRARLPWPALAAAGALVAITAALLGAGLRLTEGHFVYTLDDPYITMAIARNLVEHGDWSVTPGRFEPATSSPLWTLVLAGVYRVVGASDRVPLILNLVLAIAVVFLMERRLRPRIANGPVRGLAVLAIALAIPLPAVILTGMEAPLHVLLALLLAWAVEARWVPGVRRGPADAATGAIAIAGLSMLCVLVRFESLFLIGPLALVALLRARAATAAALATGALLAVGGYMTFSMPQGGMWLPNPVLIKSRAAELVTLQDWGRFLVRIPVELVWHRNSHMSALLVAAAWLLMIRPRSGTRSVAAARPMLLAFIAASALHVQFASLGWFYRYEAYLMALGLTTLVAVIASQGGLLPVPFARWRLATPARIAAALALLVLATPLARRSVRAVRYAAPAMRNIYEQQYQMGRFVRAHFRGREVAVNDIGLVGYYGDAKVEDLFGLATPAIADAKLARRFDTGFIERYCASRGVEVAIVYEGWFTGDRRLPGSWQPLARWTIRDNVSSDASTVTILATDPTSAPRVRSALAAFAPSLPARVSVERLN